MFLTTFLLVIFYLLAPAAIIILCRKIKFLGKIGPILILYFIGVIVGNMPFMPENAFSVQDIISSSIIPIAIPMMLFNADYKKFSVKKSSLTMVCAMIAVIITVVTGYLLFGNHIGDEKHKIGGMLMGLYTGGTPNLAALKLMLDVREETFIIINSYDMLICFFYLVFLILLYEDKIRHFI